MPTFMHQWSYKDPQVREFLEKPDARARADVVRMSIEAFGGRLLEFFFCFGEYDGVAISEFSDEETALACVMLIFGQGRVRSVRTTTLFSPTTVNQSIKIAQTVLEGKDSPAPHK
jgi:uncharacterized protein with GYD domain